MKGIFRTLIPGQEKLEQKRLLQDIESLQLTVENQACQIKV